MKKEKVEGEQSSSSSESDAELPPAPAQAARLGIDEQSTGEDTDDDEHGAAIEDHSAEHEFKEFDLTAKEVEAAQTIFATFSKF